MIVINKNMLSSSIIQINARNLIYKNQNSDMLTINSIHGQLSYLYTEIKGILTICKWPNSKHVIILYFVNSGITINKMAKVLITLIS